MAFTGKATYSAGITLPELAEDVADIVGIISPVETHLLDAIGNPLREARSTYHEWLGESIGYYLEVSYVNGSYWWPYMSSFKILLDQCGVWLSTEQIDTDMWFAILNGVLKFRITASVCADERISFEAVDGSVNSTAEVVDKIITLPRRFKYQKVSPYSIFTNGSANQIDDRQSLVEFAQSLSASFGFAAEQLQIKTACLSPIFAVGDRISTSPDSRDILGVKYDNRSICRLEKVQMDFANQQTILTAVRARK